MKLKILTYSFIYCFIDKRYTIKKNTKLKISSKNAYNNQQIKVSPRNELLLYNPFSPACKSKSTIGENIIGA